MCGIGPSLNRLAAFAFESHQDRLCTGFQQGHGSPVHPLVYHQVVADYYIYAFSIQLARASGLLNIRNISFNAKEVGVYCLYLDGIPLIMPATLQNHSLKDLNTFHVDAAARYFCACSSVRELRELISDPLFRKGPRLILGEGSNILFTDDFNGLVLRPAILGSEIIAEDRSTVQVKVGAGEKWDDFVAWTTTWHFGGIENLSLIPGSVGSSPIQNIGAYGVEAEQSIVRVFAIDTLTGGKLTFEHEACRFGYRDSIFKRSWKQKCIITSVVFRLAKKPQLNTAYREVADKMAGRARQDVETLRQVIIEIRESKLPDPARLGNAGSFFKNPMVTEEEYGSLMLDYPDMPSHPAPSGYRKIPAAWLIEQSGWKGRRIGDAGTYEKQPLVLVNHGRATGREILDLARRIEEDVAGKFGIRLDKEVNII
jgi:UDP-N-acetylmuramate dehydrogenase